MKTIKAEIICDSVNKETGDRLTTFVLEFPRFILAELNTHRAFSKNSASSRAIPFAKMVEMVKKDPFIPIAWQKEHKGMQGTEYKTGDSEIQLCINKWLSARDEVVNSATLLNNNECVTKQLCNRLLEPFMWHKVILTTSEEGLLNFFEQRCPVYMSGPHRYYSKKEFQKYANQLDKLDCAKFDDLDWLSINKGQAEIHMMALAESMYDEYQAKTKLKELKEGEYHLPFTDDLTEEMSIEDKIKVSVSRCARVSYNNFEGTFEISKDIALYEKLVYAKPPHWSPTEHVAKVMSKEDYYLYIRGKDGTASHEHGWCKNYKGFIQLREILENE